jgi:hypothetical protein
VALQLLQQATSLDFVSAGEDLSIRSGQAARQHLLSAD